MNSKKENTGALELIVMRNTFYRDSYKCALFALLMLIAINCLLSVAIVYRVSHPLKPQYFATTSDGRMINWQPLSAPVVTDTYVEQFAANAVRKAFSLDYLHWRQQLQTASGDFTPSGWRWFLSALKKSNNLKTLTSLKMVSNAEITGAPRVTEKEIVGGVYAWKVQMPISVTFTNGQRTIPSLMDVTLIVVRVPVTQDPNRIAINNFLPVPRKTAEQNLMGV